jgi:hypothetical protein
MTLTKFINASIAIQLIGYRNMRKSKTVHIRELTRLL